MGDPDHTGIGLRSRRKPKFERAFSHKVRTGCLTCKIRRKKCDEEKPTCRRCRDAFVKCDGYAQPAKPIKRAGVQKPGPTLQEAHVLYPIHSRLSDVYCNNRTETEAQFFHHFFHHTCEDLTGVRDPAGLWPSFILPLAHECEPVSHAMTAVGAAHRLFLARSLGTPGWRDLIPTALRHYNKAIAYIMPWMSCESVFSTQCTLACCLLFTCFESFIGRYAESIRHIWAGNRLLSSQVPGNSQTLDVTRELAAIFARLAVEATIFMERPIFPICHAALDSGTEQPIQPFRDLAEASYELCTLDLCQMSLIDFPLSQASQNDDPIPEESIRRRFSRWNDRFEMTKSLTSTLSLHVPQLQHLHIQRRFWIMIRDRIPDADVVSGPEYLSSFLDELEIISQPLIVSNKPTFSLDGNLISSLSFVISFAKDIDTQSRALGLLRSLNRRESIWDSRDVADLHDATLSLNDSQDWYRRKMDGGLPEYVVELSRATSRLSLDNGILVSSRDD